MLDGPQHTASDCFFQRPQPPGSSSRTISAGESKRPALNMRAGLSPPAASTSRPVQNRFQFHDRARTWILAARKNVDGIEYLAGTPRVDDSINEIDLFYPPLLSCLPGGFGMSVTNFAQVVEHGKKRLREPVAISTFVASGHAAFPITFTAGKSTRQKYGCTRTNRWRAGSVTAACNLPAPQLMETVPAPAGI